MDDLANALEKELQEIIEKVLNETPDLQAFRQKALVMGYRVRRIEIRVSLVHLITPQKMMLSDPRRQLPPGKVLDLTANDRRFLQELRIGLD